MPGILISVCLLISVSVVARDIVKNWRQQSVIWIWIILTFICHSIDLQWNPANADVNSLGVCWFRNMAWLDWLFYSINFRMLQNVLFFTFLKTSFMTPHMGFIRDQHARTLHPRPVCRPATRRFPTPKECHWTQPFKLKLSSLTAFFKGLLGNFRIKNNNMSAIKIYIKKVTLRTKYIF